MKHPILRTISMLFILAILISACNMPSSETNTPTPDLGATQTAQATHVVAQSTPPVIILTPVVTEAPTTTATTAPPTATSTSTSTATTQATPTSAVCTDMAEFVDDVTIPDDTEMLPGQEFIKTWSLQNVGTCTWTNQYSMVFVDGDQMGATSPLPLTDSVPPNSSVNISVTLKAPGTTGTYRGDWKLQNPSGVIFGLGSNAADSYYVQIKVVEGVSELNLGAATWTDNMDNANNWYLLNTDNTKFTEGDGVLVMKSINPGGGEEWDISNLPGLEDYYLEATFITGDSCSGLDRYGLLARAPDPNQGYVFEFSCDGHYRLYTWDGENYNALQEWRTSDSILAGAKQTNVMGIYMKGSDIRLYANGHKLAEFTDSKFTHGQFGLAIGSINTQNLTVSVDKVAYWDLSP